MTKDMIDLYSDYLITAFGQTSATRLSRALNNALSHDQITRALNDQLLTHHEYWKLIKPTVREIQEDNASLAIDDVIFEKPHSEENPIIAHYFDHTTNRVVKGVNIVDAAYISSQGRIPLDFEVVSKDMTPAWNFASGRFKREQHNTKNELAQAIIHRAIEHQVPFKTVLLDSWYASSETLNKIQLDWRKAFIAALKSNRRVKLLDQPELMQAVSQNKKGFVEIGSLELLVNTAYLARVEGVKENVLLTRQVFKHEDDSQGVLLLVASDLSLMGDEINQGYQKRWRVEEQHKSAKQNTMLSRGAASWVVGRLNHIFCSFVALVKLERLRSKLNLGHFALKERLYLGALQGSMRCLAELKGSSTLL